MNICIDKSKLALINLSNNEMITQLAHCFAKKETTVRYKYNGYTWIDYLDYFNVRGICDLTRDQLKTIYLNEKLI